MKSKLATPIAIALLLALGGCADDSALKKAEDKVNDALDRRQGEEVRDAAEDVRDAAKDLGDAVKDAASDAADEAKDAAEEVKDAAREATS